MLIVDILFSIVHWVAGLGVLISNVAVWVGVYWEGEDQPKDVQEIGWRLLLKGLAAEAAFGFLLFSVDAATGLAQQSKIEALVSDGSKANITIARLNDKAAASALKTAELELELAPREIRDQASFALARLSLTRKEQILVSSYAGDFEGARLAEGISKSLGTYFLIQRQIGKAIPSPNTPAFGMYVFGRDTELVADLIAWLKSNNLQVTNDQMPISGYTFSKSDIPIGATVDIASKPLFLAK